VLEAAVGPARDGAQDVEIGEQGLGGRGVRTHGGARPVVGHAQDEQRIGQDQGARRGRARDVGLVEAADLPGGQPMGRNRFGQADAVGRVGARQRHEVLHGGVRGRAGRRARAAGSRRAASAPDSGAGTPSSRCDRSVAPARRAPNRGPHAACAAASLARARSWSRPCAAATGRSGPRARASPRSPPPRCCAGDAGDTGRVQPSTTTYAAPVATTTIGTCWPASANDANSWRSRADCRTRSRSYRTSI
jgi:hypothetical protein